MRIAYRSAQVIMIAMLAAIIYNNMYLRAVAQHTPPSIPIYPAVYLGPDKDKMFITDDVRKKYIIAKVSTRKDLDDHLKNHPKTAVIYIHPSHFAAIDPTWLHRQYNNGVAIVAINVPINPLASALGHTIMPAVVDGKAIPQDDLPVRQDQMLVSVFYSVFDVHSQARTGWGWYSNYQQDAHTLLPLVNGLLHDNNKK